MRGPLLSAAVLLLAGTAPSLAQPAPANPLLRVHGHWLPPQAGRMAGAAQTARHPTAPSPVFTFLDFPGASYTNTDDINLGATPNARLYVVGGAGPGVTGEGAVAGFVTQITTKDGDVTEAYRPVPATLSDGYAEGINDSATVVGTTGTQGFMQTKKGTLTAINVPYNGAAGTIPFDLNNSDTVVGTWYTSSFAAAYGFTWRKGVFTQLPVYQGSTFTEAAGINNAGDIVGLVKDSGGVTHGFLLQGGAYTLIDPPGSSYTVGNGINDSGQIVGEYCESSCGSGGTWHGFLYSQGTYTTVDVPGVPVTSLNNINDAGTAVGDYTDANGLVHGFVVTP